MKGLVILDAAEQTAVISTGFRKWSAQVVNLKILGKVDDQLLFVVPAEATEARVQPHWLWNSAAVATDTTWKACQVQVLHPACLPEHQRCHVCVLQQSSPVEPLVKAALRAGCQLTQELLLKTCKANKAPKPIPTGKMNKKGKRGVRRQDRIVALLAATFPEIEKDSPEYTELLEALLGRKPLLAEDCADEILEGVKALDPDNQEKFAGLKSMAEKIEFERKVKKRSDRKDKKTSADGAAASSSKPRVVDDHDAMKEPRGCSQAFCPCCG